MADSSELSNEEHHARAMLLGMRYHHGNVDDPFYYKLGDDGSIEIMSMIDANTLEPLVPDGTKFEGVHDEIIIPNDRVYRAVRDATFIHSKKARFARLRNREIKRHDP